MTSKETRSLPLLTAGLLLFVGCGEQHHYREVAEVAQQAADRQAQQNTEMAQLNRDVVDGTRRMVAADAVARKDIITVHQGIQDERAGLKDGFDALEAERKEIAGERRTESILVPAAKATGMAVVAVVVVGFCWALLFGLRRSNTTDAELTELLIHDLARDEPRHLRGASTQPALESRSAANRSEPDLLAEAGRDIDETHRDQNSV
jgi:hypothetical protein